MNYELTRSNAFSGRLAYPAVTVIPLNAIPIPILTPRPPRGPSTDLEHIHTRPRIRRHIRPSGPIHIKQNIILAPTPQARGIDPRRLPIMDPLP
jgi:hypothetical protein